jgi:nucleotide-binding universal stress UspA family protein
VPVNAILLEGAAPRSLLELARARGAVLVVVGSQGHGASPLLRVGGTSERIALESNVPVLVARDAAPFERWLRGERPLRVVAGVDFTASAAAAWRWLKLIRVAGPCDVVAAHLYYAEEAAARYGGRAGATRRAHGGVEELLARDLLSFLGELPGSGTFTARAQVALGRLADHLVELAEEERADLIVVGTHHRHHAARLWSVSGGVLHLARTAVATIPSGEKQLGPVAATSVTRVLVATALDERSAGAVALAYGVLQNRAGTVHLLYVAPPARDPAAAAAEDVELEQRLRALAPLDADRGGIGTTVEVARGPVARTISEVAERLGADVICVASCRRGRVGVPGVSVVNELLRRTTKPVLVAKPPDS